MYKKKIFPKPLFALIIVVSTAIQLFLFKHYYPYPNFTPDSYNYLRCAQNRTYIDTWPIGYSLFLRLIGTLSHNDNILIFTQLLLYSLSALYFHHFLSRYFYLRTTTRPLIAIILFANPIILFLANYILSDILFLSISIIWISHLYIIVASRRISLIFILAHSIIILLAFMTRYQAFFYPIVSLIALYLSTMPSRTKRYMVISIIIPLLIFISCTILLMKKTTGIVQFSVFSGWQLANNAIYAYSYESHTIREKTSVPEKFKSIHLIVNNYIDSISRLSNYNERPVDATFIWSTSSPLQRFAHIKIQKNNTSDFIQMSKFAPFYSSYGNCIIQKLPVTYLKNYVYPNLKLYGNLPLEALGTYNCGSIYIENIAKKWFNYKSNIVLHTDLKWLLSSLWIYSFLTPIILITQFLTIIYSYTLTKWKKDFPLIYKIQFLTAIFTIINILFCTFSSPIVLRYQIFNLLISAIITILISDSLITFLNQINSTKE